MNDTVNGFDIHGVFHGVEQAQPVGAALETERVAFDEWLPNYYDSSEDVAARAGWEAAIEYARAQLAAPSPTPEHAENRTTGDKYRAELYDEVWQKARDMGYGNVTEALIALERVKPASDVVQVPRPMLEDLRDCANECYNHARMRGTSGLDNYELLTEQADALLNGGRV